MTHSEFAQVFAKQQDECERILLTKGKDYTDGEDRLSNFKDVAKLLGATPLQVWAVYWAKHVFAILNYAGKGILESEPIEGRLSDAINYLYLGRALVEEARANK